MPEVVWTHRQRQAIEADDRTLLVSAAAGSGKTAVLTERIIEKLRNNPEKADLSRMLIVTFTKAAAKELKTRIADKLNEALEENPENKHLAKQITALPSAKISTIDSFCYDIVKRNFEKLGLPCGMRIADETEISLLKSKVMNSLFDDLYGGIVNFDDFASFTDVFISDRDDTLPELFLSLYNQLSSFEQGIEFIKDCADTLAEEQDMPFFDTKCGRFAKEYIFSFLQSFEKNAERALRCFEGDDNTSARRYYDEFTGILQCIRNTRQAAEQNDFSACKESFCAFASVSMKGARIGSDSDALFCKNLREAFKQGHKEIHDRFFSHSEEQIRTSYAQSASMLRKLYDFLSVFETSFTEEKRKRAILDYADIERYALILLRDGDRPSAYALEYGATFDEIYIDEYQDINEVQDTIFRMISTSAHRFMVGDIKQSIYSFRGAKPNIFANYRTRFPEYSPKQPASAGTIFLSNNFRCAKPVIDFCNNIFSTLMNNAFADVPYLPEDNLVYSKSEDTPVCAPVEVTLIDRSSKNRSPVTEEQYVAARIQELLAEGYSPDDIVLLFRSPKKSAKKFEDELAKLEIPCFSNESSGFFENPEILLALCLLNVIDNPRRDIYLAGALKSPVFGFTLDELTLIRQNHSEASLYDALIAYAECTPSAKTEFFFSWLAQMREYACAQPIDKLIWRLYTTTSLLCDAYANTGESQNRRANLMMLYEHARKFEAGSFKGLYNFILYINQIIESEARIEEAKSQSDSVPSVRIMSVHASKGLEFKVCFLCAAEYSPKSEESRDGILMSSELGIGTYTPDPTGFAKINSIIRKTIGAKVEADRIAEEMRVLYVALTRAKERLFITASPLSAHALTERCEQNAASLSRYTALSCGNFISMILTALKAAGGTDPCWKMQIIGTEGIEENRNQAQSAAMITEETIQIPDIEQCKKEIKERFAFQYPYTALSKIPSKMSVSKLYPSVLDDEEEQGPPAVLNEKPRFLSEEQTATPAERGTATHMFMQFCDFENVLANGVNDEIERLITQKFITPDFRDAIYRDKLARFFSSSLFAQMRKAENLYREVRFNINMPAASFTECEQTERALKEETILVQGVIDCFFITKQGTVTIVDYKTDSFTEKEKENPERCAQVLRERHKTQLGYYRIACEKLLTKSVDSVVIYSFDLGMEIEL